jgi:hypothetical protein
MALKLHKSSIRPGCSNEQPATSSMTPDAEPDVTWGDGGIDDWGWVSAEPSPPLDPCPAAATSTCPEGA